MRKSLNKRLEKAWRITYRKKNGGTGSMLIRGTRKEAKTQFRAIPRMEKESCKITDMRKVRVARPPQRHPSELRLGELENTAESLSERMSNVEGTCRALRQRLAELEGGSASA